MADDPRTEPCFLHEITNCVVCTGADKDEKKQETDREAELLAKPGYMRAKFSGRCAKCKSFHPSGVVIRYSEYWQGWVSMSCCEW